VAVRRARGEHARLLATQDDDRIVVSADTGALLAASRAPGPSVVVRSAEPSRARGQLHQSPWRRDGAVLGGQTSTEAAYGGPILLIGRAQLAMCVIDGVPPCCSWGPVIRPATRSTDGDQLRLLGLVARSDRSIASIMAHRECLATAYTEVTH